jgi:hypothetical protein
VPVDSSLYGYQLFLAQEKQNKASPALLEAHSKYTDAIFQELETLRLKI